MAYKNYILVCGGTGCEANKSDEIFKSLHQQAEAQGVKNEVQIVKTGCFGFCEKGPIVKVLPQESFYVEVKPEDAREIIAEQVVKGREVKRLLYRKGEAAAGNVRIEDIESYQKQFRIVLRNCGVINPENIDEYIAREGYAALEKALFSMTSDQIVAELKTAGLRGRGGAGFPTWLKWDLTKKAPGDQKYVICNADEGDPGAYMDRSVLEGNPHSIIEGMVIGAFATGATEGIVYVRNEYPLAIRHLTIALGQAREHGLLGENILGSGLAFDIQIVRGAGAFVCGEETALIRSVEGRMGEPRQRPPFPIQKGINGKPTAINNVETWANIPVILRQGAEEFAKIGTKGNSGTKIFSLVGKIRNTGLVEVPMGITLKQIVYDIGGGPVGKARIKAVQTGGPSGGCIPAEKFDLPIDYDSLAQAGSIMGSGGMIVMDANTCMVDVAKYFMNFLKDESCGKCFSCRKGTQRMYEILDDISGGRGRPEHLELLEELARVVKDTTMCGLGQTASNPVLSTLRYFREEYERHVVDKKCDAFVCRNLVGASCQAACPLETEAWRYVALIEKGRYEEAYSCLRSANPFPSICARVCDRKCEQKCQLGVTGSEPLAIRALKRFVTDRVDPAVYKPTKAARRGKGAARVAVVGAGPAGLSAAHYLSLLGHKVTLFEAEDEPGGMLTSCIPPYRLPRSVLKKEIASLLNGNATVKCRTVLGRDITIDGLFADGFKAVFLALGAHKSWRLDLPGEALEGVYPSIEFLKAFNLMGEELAGGHVAVIGGGNSAVDAARVAIRQENVQSVTLLYRRTGQEMPAYAEEVDAALEEGIKLETLVSPVKIRYIETAVKEGIKVETMVSPVRIYSQNGRLVGIECIRNTLGEVDASGRRRPVPVPGSEFSISLNTLIIAIGERPDSDCLTPMGLALDKGGRLQVDPRTLRTSRNGVFAGGDLVTGPNTVVDAIAAGRRAAGVIDRFLRGEELAEPPRIRLPDVFVESAPVTDEDREDAARAEPPVLPIQARRKNFAEVELALSVEQATREARRCLRCDLAFTQPQPDEAHSAAAGGTHA